MWWNKRPFSGSGRHGCCATIEASYRRGGCPRTAAPPTAAVEADTGEGRAAARFLQEGLGRAGNVGAAVDLNLSEREDKPVEREEMNFVSLVAEAVGSDSPQREQLSHQRQMRLRT